MERRPKNKSTVFKFKLCVFQRFKYFFCRKLHSSAVFPLICLSFWLDYLCVCVCVRKHTESARWGRSIYVTLSLSLSLSLSVSSRSVLAVFPPSHFSLSLFVCLSLSFSLSSARPCGTSDEEFHPSTSPVSYLSFPLCRSFAFCTGSSSSAVFARWRPTGDLFRECKGGKRRKKKTSFFSFLFLPRGPPD